MRLGFVLVPVLLSVGIALGWMGSAFRADAEPPSEPPADRETRSRHVRVATVGVPAATQSRLAFGVVQAADHANLSFPLSGRLASRAVDIGDWVTAGDLLATLDSTTLNHRVRAARSQSEGLELEAAQLTRDAERVTRLREMGASTEQVREQATTALGAARSGEAIANAQLAEVRQLVRDASLRAPFRAQVTAVGAEPGEFVHAGTPIVSLSGDGTREVRTEVTAQLVRLIETGTLATVDIPALGLRDLPARVVSVTSGTPSPGHLFPVILSVESSAPPVGASAEIRFGVPADEGRLVPTSAVLLHAGMQTYVLRFDSGVVRVVAVRVGEVIGAFTRVLGELAEGDEVVVGGHSDLADGDAVQAVR